MATFNERLIRLERQMKEAQKRIALGAGTHTITSGGGASSKFGVSGEDDTATEDRRFLLDDSYDFFIANNPDDYSYLGMYSDGEMEIYAQDPEDGNLWSDIYVGAWGIAISLGSSSEMEIDGLVLDNAPPRIITASNGGVLKYSNSLSHFGVPASVTNSGGENFSTTSLVPSTMMAITIASAGIYEFEGLVYLSTQTSDGVKVGLSYTGTWNGYQSIWEFYNSDSVSYVIHSLNSLFFQEISPVGLLDGGIVVEGYMRVKGVISITSAGTLALAAAVRTSGIMAFNSGSASKIFSVRKIA